MQEQPISCLSLIMGDQLHAGHSWFKATQDDRLFVLMEIRQETDYVVHHRQKVLAFFCAMRHFADALVQAGHRVLYLKLDAADNTQNLTQNLDWILEHTKANEVNIQQADEYRVDQQLQNWAEAIDCTVHWHDSEHFFTQRDVLDRWFSGKSNTIMEHFYRRIRKETGYLMTADGQPEGRQWNYDKDNREKLPRECEIPQPLCFANDVSAIDRMLTRCDVKTMGNADPKRLIWPVTRSQARELLNFFVTHLLVHFGRYQDAMTPEGWALYHARVSFALNAKMITPREVVDKAVEYWRQHQDRVTLAQIEGFVRQVIGWREYVRAIYWQRMPDYESLNHFDHDRDLPDFYWTAETKMACLQYSIRQSLDYAYAHHIQRLMVTGNFALLIGTHPDAVDHWYLGIYIDALQWVELPNTRGMSQYADGGVLATKPYISSGSYIHKMSHYCGDCHYDVQRKVGEKACPFNSLYWHFIDRHFEELRRNPRMALITKQWEKRADADKAALIEQAEHYLQTLDAL